MALSGCPRQAREDGVAIIMTYSVFSERLHFADYWGSTTRKIFGAVLLAIAVFAACSVFPDPLGPGDY